MHNIAPVILCGGSGTRLWPLSRETYPKQFVDLGGGRTLFKDTVLRAQRTPDSIEPVIVCNEAHRFYVTAELYKCGLASGAAAQVAASAGGSNYGKILLEPAPRNTAPAIALAAFALQDGGADPLMLVLPSDHAIGDEAAFFEGVKSAAALAEQGYIVTFGITPTGPETGFGYIACGAADGHIRQTVIASGKADVISHPGLGQAKRRKFFMQAIPQRWAGTIIQQQNFKFLKSLVFEALQTF